MDMQKYFMLSVEFRERIVELKSLYDCYKNIAGNFRNAGLTEPADYWQIKVHCLYDVFTILGLENLIKG